MNQEQLLRDIAQTGYNVGFGAKKHFASFDMVTKIPSVIALLTMAVGIFGLAIPSMSLPIISATVLVLGLIAKDINSYQHNSDEIERAGVELTKKRDQLRAIYRKVVSKGPNEDLGSLMDEYETIRDDAKSIGVSKHLLFSNWYAHYKFFWEDQTDWIDEQLQFKLLRDKVPLSLTASVVVLTLAAIGAAIHSASNQMIINWICHQ